MTSRMKRIRMMEQRWVAEGGVRLGQGLAEEAVR